MSINSDRVSLSDVVAIAKSVAPQSEIPNNINVDSVNSLNSTINMKFTEAGDDKGVALEGGQFSVGTATSGQESVFGQGDSVPVSIAFQYDATTQVGLTIPTATDITDILRSDTGSTVSMFANNTAEQVIMIGEDFPPVGVKSKWDTLGSLASEPDRISGEYLNSSDIWDESTYMVTGANFPYSKYSWSLANETNEQLRFGLSIINPNADFELKTLNVNGVDYTKYWVRIRLTTPLTSVPTLQQVKSHTNRTEINSDGMVEFFGNARGVKDIITDSYANNLSDPANENVTYFTGGIDGGSSKIVDNEFADNTRDSRMLIVKIDEDVDTSTPLLISYPFYVNGIQTGDIRFDIEYVQITENFIYDSKVEPDGALTVIYPIITPSNLERQVLQFEVPINEVDSNVGGVAIVLTRDANLPEDTVGASVVLTGDNARGRRWRL